MPSFCLADELGRCHLRHCEIIPLLLFFGKEADQTLWISSAESTMAGASKRFLQHNSPPP